MLTSEQIDALRDAAGKIADPINDFLIRDIARRVSEAGQLTSTASYQVWRAQQLGLSQREIKKRIKKMLGVSNRELRKLMTQAAEVGYGFDIRHLPYVQAVPFAQNAALQQIVSAAVKLAQDDFTNLTQTLGMVCPDGRAQPLQTAYRQCMDYAFEQVFTGAIDYNTAIRQAVKNIADLGVRVIEYESGVHTSIEAATRRSVMGGLGLMQEQISQQNHDDMGANGWEISAHAASAPDHEPIQGRQYSDKEYETLNNSLARRIGTLNCGHAAFPIILGVSSPQYTEAELAQMRRQNADGVTYEGKHYTMYEATQKQRQVERAIRRQKNRILVDESTGDADKLKYDQIRLTRLNQEYRRFSKAVGLPTQRERAQVAGFGTGEATRTTGYAKRQEKMASDFTSRMETAGYKVQGFDYYTGDQRTLDEMLTAYQRMAQQYPDAANGLTISRSFSPDKDTIGWYDRGTRTIHFNRDVVNNWSKLQKEYAALVDKGRFPVGTDARGCFYHEFGHAVGYFRGIRSYRKDVDSVLFDMGYGRMNFKQRDGALRKELSGYAVEVTNPAYQEALAEAFSEWYNSDTPREFCKAFLERVGMI